MFVNGRNRNLQSNFSACVMLASMRSSEKGGFISNDPEIGLKPKNVPREPK